jgi:hypothetical protein
MPDFSSHQKWLRSGGDLRLKPALEGVNAPKSQLEMNLWATKPLLSLLLRWHSAEEAQCPEE